MVACRARNRDVSLDGWRHRRRRPLRRSAGRGASSATSRVAPRPAARRRLLGRRARRRHDPRIRIRPADGLPRPRATSRSASRRAATIRDQQLPDGGWAIYPGGPAEISASVKAYFALKLVGVPDRRPGDGPGPRGDPRRAAVRRRATASRGSTSRCSGQIAYDDCPSVPPELVLSRRGSNFSLARDVGLDADDRRAAVDHLGLQAGPAARRRSRDRRAVPRRPAAPAVAPDDAARLAGRTSSSASTGSSSGPSAGVPDVVAAAGHPRGAPLDARPLRELRRPGRDLPADDLHGRRAQVPGLRRRLGRRCSGRCGSSKTC